MQNATNHIKRELQLTADGSHTLFIPEMDEHYHSVNGAVQESRHVFIEAGLHHLERKEIVVLEIGFGTGPRCINGKYITIRLNFIRLIWT